MAQPPTARRTCRLLLAASCVTLVTTLQACSTGKWRLTEEGQAAFSRTRAGEVDLTVRYDRSELSDSFVALLERASLILSDEEQTLIDLQARIDRALTPTEREALTERRDALVNGMLSQVDQLKVVIGAAGPRAGTASVAIVYTAIEVASASADCPVMTARFNYVSALGPSETPAGIVVREVTPRHALSALVDAMERFAKEKEALSAETRRRLSAE
ncbi:MAG: hypothetical protein KIT58_19955 [Planctomycetota bacterium]|nr:hypothetical protein [Planctomycetota bacterium]